MKIGLCLGGGGAKGAYQVGVYQALREFNLTKKIKAVSGTSIGALNLTILGMDLLEEAKYIWGGLNVSKVIKFRNPLNIFNFKKPSSILSNTPMVDVFKEHMDFNKLVKYKDRNLFVGVTNLNDDIGENIKLNNLDGQLASLYVLASASMPLVFPNVIINKTKYMDGYKYLNVPIQCLIDDGCDLIFAVPLSSLGAPNEDSYPNSTIIDFNPKEFKDLNLINGTLNFKQDTLIERFDLGYKNGIELLTYLRKIGLIKITLLDKIKGLFRKKNYKKYYCIDDIKKEAN